MFSVDKIPAHTTVFLCMESIIPKERSETNYPQALQVPEARALWGGGRWGEGEGGSGSADRWTHRFVFYTTDLNFYSSK